MKSEKFLTIPTVLVLVLKLIFLQGCRGFDDDKEFYPETIHSLFLCTDSSGNLTVVDREPGGNYSYQWNESKGISDADLSDLAVDGEKVWISSGETNTIVEIDYSDDKEERTTYSGLSLHPHFICAGKKYILFSDTLENQIGLLKIKNGELVGLSASAKPGKACYNAGKFYIDIGGDVTIFSELAMTAYTTVAVGKEISEFHLNSSKVVLVENHDSVNYEIRIDPNGDIAASSNYAVSFSEVRYCPWYAPTYGTEFMQDIYLTSSLVSIPSYTDSVDHFEVDFFEARMFSAYGDSLKEVNLNSGAVENSIGFGMKILKACFVVK